MLASSAPRQPSYEAHTLREPNCGALDVGLEATPDQYRKSTKAFWTSAELVCHLQTNPGMTHVLVHCLSGIFCLLNRLYMNYVNGEPRERRVGYGSYCQAVSFSLKCPQLYLFHNWLERFIEL